MRRWWVISPVYLYTDVIDVWGGPTYEERDVVEVEAETREDARVCGLRMLRKEFGFHDWNDGNPLNGLKVEESDEVFNIV